MKNSVSHAYQRIDVAEWTRAKWMLNEQYELETLHKNAFKWTLLIVPFLLYMRAWTPVRIICIRMKWLLNGQFVNKMTFSNAIIANAHRLKRRRSLAGVCYFKIPFRFILIRFLLKKISFYYPLSHYFFRVRIFCVVAIGYFSLSKSHFNQTEQHYRNNKKSISIWTRMKKSSLTRSDCPLQNACYLIRICLILFYPAYICCIETRFF